ncbi:MAG TPA: hypothetical protein VEK79_21755 [Thermoanaerobaculia bacterium]|nr:hypothetical protein [Thermoanaerobaculia bacterium]
MGIGLPALARRGLAALASRRVAAAAGCARFGTALANGIAFAALVGDALTDGIALAGLALGIRTAALTNLRLLIVRIAGRRFTLLHRLPEFVLRKVEPMIAADIFDLRETCTSGCPDRFILIGAVDEVGC